MLELVVGVWLVAYMVFAGFTVYMAMISFPPKTWIGKYMKYHGIGFIIVLTSSVVIGFALMLATVIGGQLIGHIH